MLVASNQNNTSENWEKVSGLEKGFQDKLKHAQLLWR